MWACWHFDAADVPSTSVELLYNSLAVQHIYRCTSIEAAGNLYYDTLGPI